jgi:hypothetical protein
VVLSSLTSDLDGSPYSHKIEAYPANFASNKVEAPFTVTFNPECTITAYSVSPQTGTGVVASLIKYEIGVDGAHDIDFTYSVTPVICNPVKAYTVTV